MRIIYKYPIPLESFWEFTLELPAGAKILAIQNQNAFPMMWVEVRTEKPLEPRHFRIFGTGVDMPDDSTHILLYVGTFQSLTSIGNLVWHVYEVTL